ncbi:DoxX family protein [Geothrix mesophila]|uniref:DoxX family protein n=1 Tax=Geothrix mesophila TaxID=2922723 RepID=UPI001FADBA29|nr:DoxX family protein [Geothrix sp. SG198]
MPTNTQPIPIPTGRLWAGRILSALPILFLLFDGIAKVLQLPPVLEGTAKLGYPLGVVVPLGLTLLACTVLYAVPRTSVLGAIFLTGYLGGAVASHVRVGDPLFSHALFPTYVAVLIWGGLFLRDARLRALLPFARPLA